MGPRSASPLSEGEIASGDEEKAISTNASKTPGGRVNTSIRLSKESPSRGVQGKGTQQFRNDTYHHFRDDDRAVRPPRQRSPSRRERSRSRSPYRADKTSLGDKRQHDDDHYSRNMGSDPRRFRVHYEGRKPHDSNIHPGRQHRNSDHPGQARDQAQLNNRNGGPRETNRKLEHRARDRDRSRSPFRHGSAQPSASKVHSKTQRSNTPPDNARDRSSDTSRGQDASSKHPRDAKEGRGQGSQTHPESTTQSENNGEAEQNLSEKDIIEQRRKRREAIKARHQKQQPSLLVQALDHSTLTELSTPLYDSSGSPSEQQSPPPSTDSPQTPQRDTPPESPAAINVTNDEDLVNHRQSDDAIAEDEGPSAADYDPNMDMQEDRPEHKRSDMNDGAPNRYAEERPAAVKGAVEKEFDMFGDDEDDGDDMFAPADVDAKTTTAGTKQAKALDASLLDNWDYPDGHYRIILGELLDGRYAIQQQIGKGTFATVIRAQDTRTGGSVAVKIACNNDTMYKAGQKEMEMLEQLNQQDPEDKKHIIRLLGQFEHKGHLCLVFENLSADLREVLKKFGRNVGINLKAIRSYAQQMFLSLSHLKKSQILHADLKPDNILVSEKRSVLKICDLGTASFADDAEVTPYLVSRFYRAPEVILGMPFDYAIDMWSIGCTLYELYTGRILFAGADNNQMLRSIQECRGKFPMRMLKRSTLADRHFDIEGNFFSQERDQITGKATLRQVNLNKATPGKDLRARLSGNTKGMKPEEIREHTAFIDLMEKCLQLDPARRVTPNDALKHAFIAHATTPQPVEKSAAPIKVAMNVQRMR